MAAGCCGVRDGRGYINSTQPQAVSSLSICLEIPKGRVAVCRAATMRRASCVLASAAGSPRAYQNSTAYRAVPGLLSKQHVIQLSLTSTSSCCSPRPAASASAGSTATGWRFVATNATPTTSAATQTSGAASQQHHSATTSQAIFFDELCQKGAHEETLAWVKLRWCSSWQQVRTLYTFMSSGGSMGLDGSSGTSGSLDKNETYAFLLQLQDFFHPGAPLDEMADMLAFRAQLADDLCRHIPRLDAEQLEAVCCVSATTPVKWTNERSDAVQLRLTEVCRGPEAVTPTINCIFALHAHGQLPQVALLQRLFRVAVDHLCEMTPSQWEALNRVARKFRFLVDDTWLDDLNKRLTNNAANCSDFGRMLGIAGTLAAFVANGTAEMLDTRVAASLEVLERRFDVGRSLMTDQQLCQFTALLCGLRSHYFIKWQRYVKAQLTGCTTHLHSLSPGTVMLGVDLVVKGEGWREPRPLLRLVSHVVDHFASRPTLHNAATVAEWLLRHSQQARPPPRTTAMLRSTKKSMTAAAAANKTPRSPPDNSAEQPLEPVPVEELRAIAARLATPRALHGVEPSVVPRLMRTLHEMRVALPQEWVDKAYGVVASRVSQVDTGTLLAMVNGVHAYGMHPALSVLEPLWAEYARYLPLMRPVEMMRLLESWVAARYLPDKAMLEGFMAAMASLLIMEPAAKKAPAASTIVSVAQGGSATPLHQPTGEAEASRAGSSSSSSSSSGRAGEGAAPVAAVAGAGAVTANNNTVPAPLVLGSSSVTVTPQGPPTLPSTILETDPAAAAVVAAAAADSITSGASIDVISAPAPGSSGSSGVYPQGGGIVLTPTEAQRMLGVHEEYREMFKELKRPDLVTVMNQYRNELTAVLYTMKREQDRRDHQASGDKDNRTTARLLHSLLHGRPLQ